MTLILNAILVTLEMMGLFISAFVVMYLLALLLKPIETGLSRLVWKHSSHTAKPAVIKPTFKDFSQKHR